jgi:ATP-dependent Lon protease
MASPLPDPQGSAQGYALLLWVDPKSGRFNGSETILVPLPLADRLNAARRELYDKRARAGAWARACVNQAPPAPPEDDDDDLDPEDSAAQLRAVREPLQPRPAVPIPPPAAPVAPPTASKRRAAGGQAVPVISAAAITERRKSVELRIKYSSEEKKTEMRSMDDLLARGETRLVGLRRDWRTRIALMRSDMPHLSKVIDRIEACCALAAFTRQPLRIPPLLLVGPPGVGKTHFAKGVAELLGVPTFIYALESAETVSVLTGSDKHWWNSEAGQLFKLIVQGEFANPLVVLDELDKVATGGNHYRPANALHAVLEESTAQQLRDKCIDLTFDASYTVYVATANRLSTIDASLLSRFELFHVDAPGPRAAVSIARAVGQQVLQELKLTRRFDAPTGEVVQQLALLGSPRQMHKVLAAAIGRAVIGGRTRVAVADLLDGLESHLPRSGGDEPVH